MTYLFFNLMVLPAHILTELSGFIIMFLKILYIYIYTVVETFHMQ